MYLHWYYFISEYGPLVWSDSLCCEYNVDTLLFLGYAGGSHYSHSGGGANYLCLTPSPVFHPNGPGGSRGYVYGAEYESPPLPATQDHDVPCAVCESPRCAVFTQPGSDVCPSGWITEYAGWLASSHTNHQRAEFVCVDRYAENGGLSDSQNGALFYPTQTRCGSLPCDPYENARDLSCAVCSK